MSRFGTTDYNSLPRKFYGYNESPRYHYLSDHAVSKDYDSSRFLGDSLTTSVPPRRSSTGYSNLDPGFSSNYLHSSYGNLLASTPIASQKKYNYSFENIRDKYNEYSPRKSTYSLHSTSSNHRNYSPSHYGSRLTPTRTVWNTHHADLSPPVWSRQSPSAESVKTRLSSENETSSSQTTSSTRGNVAQDSTFKHTDHESSEKLHTDPSECREKNSVKETSSSSSCENSSSEKKARLSSEEEEEEEEEEDYHFDQTIGTELISKDADDPSQASYNSAASQGSDLNKSEEANDADSVKYSESASYESGLSHGTPPWQQFCDYEYTTESDEDKGGDDDESGKGDENVNQFYHLCVLEDEEESAEPAKNNTADISADDTYVAPPWEQFCDYGLSQEEDDEEDEDDEKRTSEKSKDDGTQNLSTYDPSVWNQFCDYSVSQAEEDEQLEKLEVEDSEKSSTSTIPPWQQFCDYNMSADEEVENTSASDASNAWRQFCDYDENTAVPKIDIQLAEDKEQVHQKQSGDDADHLKVAAVPTASESEDTTDDEMPTPVRRISQVQMLSLSPSNSSYAGFSSSDYDSDYETSLDSRDKKYPIFMLKQEQPEERGRVEPHLAQPAPVFSITLDYSECTDEDDAEEEAEGDEEEVSEYEDLSDREYSDDDMVMKSALTSSDYSDQFWTLQGEHPETTGLTTDDEDLAVSMRTSPISNDNHAELKQSSKTASPVPSTVEDESKLLMQYADKLHVNDNEALASFTYEQPPALHIASVGELQSDRALLTQTCQPRVGIAEKYDDGPERVSEMATVNCSKSEEPKISLTEIEQKLQYAKQIEERWPSHWADRYEWRRPSVCMAIRRVAKGVAEVARVAPKIQFHFANLKLNLRRASVCQHEIKFVFPELYKPKKPSLALARLSVVPKQPLNTAILAIQPIIRRSERRDSRIPPTTAADVAEQRSQASRKKSLMIERMSEKFKDGPPAPLLPSVSTAPVPKQAPKSEEPSFEQQLEELRRKMHLGASQFSEQAKSLSRGIGEGTSSRKLAAQSEVTRSLMSEATNLRQKASEQCEQLKQSKLDKNQSISSDKSRTARAVPSPRSEIAENEAKSLESPKSVPTDTRKSTTTIRQPQKVASPFFHKEKQEVMANQELERSKEALNRKRQELKAAEAAKAAVGKAKEAEVSPLATTDGHAKSVEQAKQPTGVASVGVGKQRPTESTAQLEQSTIASKRATAGCSPVPATAQPKQMVAVGKQKPVAQVAQVQKSSVKRGEMVDQGSASDVKIHSTPVKDEAAVIRQAKQPVYAQLVGIRGSDVKQQAQVVVPKLPLTKPFKWKRPKAKSHHRRNNRLISSLRDIDELLGLKNRIKTFDQFEVFLGNCAKDIRRREQNVPPTGAAMWSPRKIYIYADAVDADVVFYSRKDLQQLLELFSPSSKITFNYDFSEKTKPTSKWANHFSNVGRPQNRGTSKSKQPLRRNCDDDDNDDDEDDRLTIRVQYLNDKDPFATAASCLEPAFGRSFRFSLQTTLLEQLPSVLRLLNAPHKVEDAAMQIVSCQNATPVDYGNYLDLDMSLVEQPDELAVLKESISVNAIEQYKYTYTYACVRVIIGMKCSSSGLVKIYRVPIRDFVSFSSPRPLVDYYNFHCSRPVVHISACRRFEHLNRKEKLASMLVQSGAQPKASPSKDSSSSSSSSSYCQLFTPKIWSAASAWSDSANNGICRAGLRRRSSFTVADAALINPSAAGLSGYSTAREQATTSSLLNSFIQQQNGNNIVVRTQLSCRVHTIIEKLLNSTGRDLRRILFSLKQIFQDDKDLVHEFVQNDGLACLIKVGAEADQNYQNYILRALGQVMLYVDGMNGVIAHNETIQWLYSLLGSQFRLVVKTALKLLLVFVKYTESNSLLLLAAVYIVDRERGVPPWSHVMGILNDKDCGDTELLVYAMTLLNRSLNGVPDQDTYYDIVDALEEQGMEATVRHLQSLRSRELSEQCRMYEAMLDKEDSEEVATSNGGITTKRAGTRTGHNSGDRRSSGVREKVQPDQEVTCRVKKLASNLENAESAEPKTAGLSEKKKLSMDLLYKNNSNSINNNNNNNVPEEIQPTNGERSESQKAPPSRPVLAPPPALPDLSSLDSAVEQPKQRIGAVHSLAVKYQQQQKPDVEPSPAGSKMEPTAANDDESSAQPGGGGGDTFANALSRARKGMEKKLAAREAIDTRKESEIQWEKALQNLNRPLIVNDLDFTELNDADDQDPLRLVRAQEMSAAGGGVDSLSRPPPPPLFAQTLGSIPGPPPPPPPQAASTGGPPPPPPVAKQESGMGHRSSTASRADRVDSKTVKLHWKEAQCKPLPGVLDKDGGIFWQKVKPVAIDTEKLGNLFVTKTKELAPKKKDDKKLEIRVLDTKRSNAINIGLTKLPPPRAIKTAVLKFDSSIMNKECIEKVLSTMMPTAEEQEAIAGAQAANPDLPLGSAEQFLLMLSEIPQLHARLRLWLFMLDYANVEREVAEPLMDLKLAMEELDKSRTFKQVMATLLAVGNFLNGAEVRGFQIDYLAKVPEVKDTVKANLEKLEKDCKSSWDYLRVVAKHESHSLKEKISGFLTDCAQRILTLKIIHKRVINRFRKFLLYMGMPQPAIKDTKINTICKTISEFALEYRTCREKILQQKKRLQDKRERNKTRGKLITDAKSWTQRNNPTNSSSTAENANAQKNHEELSKVLKSTGNADASWNLSYPGSRTRQKITQPTAAEVRSTMGEAAESPDDEILDGLVKAATTTGDHPREYRRRARQFNRKSLRRTRTLKLVDDQINGTCISNSLFNG
ncbi:FH1/FH2 domain-containing protein 3 [Trichinella murrelli]|uniref:FH1/FH2 domain-containing protein 3 n=1 Tax=Trichinella murrelli TaxID=144512 RepID=A0A0V0TNP4_9BILA|nr:FH1/FH2 domain-containing protein 3 [Trichinella murrelli]